MEKEKTVHLGNNIRKIRLLRGMKQATFAQEMGIAQQNISKLENKMAVSDKQLKQAAEILNTTVENIKKFHEAAIINTNIFSKDQINNPITEVITYFKDELAKKDEELERLRNEIEFLKHGEQKITKPNTEKEVEEKKLKAL